MLVIYLLYLSSSIFVATPALMSLMEQAGMDVTRGFAPTSEQMIVISQLLTENPALYLKICLPMLCLLLLLALLKQLLFPLALPLLPLPLPPSLLQFKM